jgi:hypothetical protein
MTDPRRTEGFGPTFPASSPASFPASFPTSEPITPPQPWYPPVDPAYADQSPWAPTYIGYAPIGYAPPWPPGFNAQATQQAPGYWPQGAPLTDEPTALGPAPAPPDGPKSPRWLWVATGAALFLVVSLVIALAIANEAIKRQTAVPPLAPMPETTSEFPTPRTSSTPTVPTVPVMPSAPSIPSLPPSTLTPPPSRTPTPAVPPTDTTAPAAMQDVVYSVTGDGRALSIMYIATGNVIQTEFNVALPWTKEVSLAKSAVHPAAVTVVNFGRNVTCSVTVAGVQVSQRVGAGLTVCGLGG